jgi:hypothetical protein
LRPYLVAFAALLAFVAAALGAVWYFTRTTGGGAGPPAAPGSGPITPGPGAATTIPFSTVPRPEPPPPPLLTDPAPPPPPPGSWEAVPRAPRLAALGPLGGALLRALNDLEPRLTACQDEDSQARHGPIVPTQTGDGSDEGAGVVPVLMLQIETGAGTARVVDAPVDTRGGASDGLLSCAQQAVRGLTVDFAQGQPGKRYRVPYSLVR